MIDEEMTLAKFGHTSEGLTYGSCKRVCVVCSQCGEVRDIDYREYLKLKSGKCYKCYVLGDPVVAKDDPEYDYKLSLTNVDEEKTMRVHGYYSIDLASYSESKVFAVCSQCKDEREISHASYTKGTGMCLRCATSGPPMVSKDDPDYDEKLKNTGINEVRTKLEFGYHSIDLSYGSAEEVWSVCRVCGEERKIKYTTLQRSSGMCGKCSSIHRSRLIRGPFNIEYFQSVQEAFNSGEINEVQTFDEFGHYSIDLTSGTIRQVYVICDICGEERVIDYRFYIKDSCRCEKCSRDNIVITLETRIKQSMAKQGITDIDLWTGFISKIEYPPEFYIMQPIVRNNANNLCELCSKNVIDNGAELSVHHINRNKQDNRLNNLIAVCKHCHGPLHNPIDESHLEYIKSLEDYPWN